MRAIMPICAARSAQSGERLDTLGQRVSRIEGHLQMYSPSEPPATTETAELPKTAELPEVTKLPDIAEQPETTELD